VAKYEVVSADNLLRIAPEVLAGFADEADLSALPSLGGTGDPSELIGDLDTHGLDAELLFPAFVGPDAIAGDRSAALVRAYNAWLSERFTAADPDRLLGLALIPSSGIGDAVEELRRAAVMPGIHGVVLTSWPSGFAAPQPEDDQFWAAASEFGMPIAVYKTFGGGEAADRPATNAEGASHFPRMTSLMTKGGGPYTGIQLINSGVLDRFPALQFYFAHTNVSWEPYYREQADDYYKRHHFWAGVDLPKAPSEYLYKHFRWGFSRDRLGVQLRHEVGVERLLWGRGVAEEDDPIDTATVLKEQFADVPDADRKRILATNVVEFFHLG
jgi:predicted TIM-barrel fold metal-dependent hydrolase